MDMYRFVAVCENDSTSKQLTYTPENFEGVKINREFSFVPPYGFTPKNAVDSMRVIKDDAAFFTAKNVAFGYFLKMKLYVSKLNADGMTYSPLMTLVVNSETISQTKDYIEFSVDVVNSASSYFQKKSTKINLPLQVQKNMLVDFYKVNNVSINATSFVLGAQNTTLFPFIKSEGMNIIHDEDISLYDVLSYDSKNMIYQCINGGDITFYYNINVAVGASTQFGITPTGSITVYISTYNGTTGVKKTNIYEKTYAITENLQSFIFSENSKKVISLDPGDFIMMSFVRSGLQPETRLNFSSQVANLTIKKTTAIKYLKPPISSISLPDLFTSLFTTIDFTDVDNTFITSDKQLVNNITELSIIPQDFVREISAGLGLVFNFDNDKTTIENINSYFTRLNAAPRITIDTYKDLSVLNQEQIYSSVTFGFEKFDTENNVYYFHFQKKLTFEQMKENGDSLELVCNKLSFDAEKIVNRINEAAFGNNQTSNDTYYVVPLRNIYANENINIADNITPREMALKNKAILELYFGNYTNTSLVLSDNDGVDENLAIRELDEYNNMIVVRQHDAIILTDTPHLRPIVYEFTGLIGEADFSEHFAEMVDFNGDKVDLFVYSSETTDKLGEIKCKSLVFK